MEHMNLGPVEPSRITWYANADIYTPEEQAAFVAKAITYAEWYAIKAEFCKKAIEIALRLSPPPKDYIVSDTEEDEDNIRVIYEHRKYYDNRESVFIPGWVLSSNEAEITKFIDDTHTTEEAAKVVAEEKKKQEEIAEKQRRLVDRRKRYEELRAEFEGK